MKLKAVHISVSPHRVSIFLENGKVIHAPLIDEDISQFINESLEAIRKDGFFYLDEEDLKIKTDKDDSPLLDKFTSSGLVSLYRSSKKMIKELFRGKKDSTTHELDLENILKRSKRLQTLNELSGDNSLDEEQSTVVAVVKDTSGNKTIIPNIESLDKYFDNALKTGNHEGVEKFIQRLAVLQNKRNYSSKDLLNFLKNNNMPISVRGDIIAFKGLCKTDNEGVYVDSYTKNVTQGLYYDVFMDEDMVDSDRNKSCSNGLHVASNKYLSDPYMNTTDTCFIILINPEDVIAVPLYDQTKIRVSKYFIADVLTDDEYESVRKGKEAILNNPTLMDKINKVVNTRPLAVAGTQIVSNMGKKLIQHNYVNDPLTKPETTSNPVEVKETVEALTKPTKKDKSLESSKNINNIIKKENRRMTNLERMKLLVQEYNKGGNKVATAKEIMTLKRTAKQSWEYFNVSKKDAYSIETTFKNS